MADPATEAGDSWRATSKYIDGGFAVKVLASHILFMLGRNEWKRPIWRERRVPPDGKTFDTATFADYLLLPSREGLGLSSLLTVHKLCEAAPEDGQQAIAALRREIPDYDAYLEHDRKEVLDAAPEHREHRGSTREERGNRGANSTSKRGSTHATYLASRLKTQHPEEWNRYMDGEYRSVRATAIAAGIVKPTITVPLEVEAMVRALKRHLTESELRQLSELLTADPRLK